MNRPNASRAAGVTLWAVAPAIYSHDESAREDDGGNRNPVTLPHRMTDKFFSFEFVAAGFSGARFFPEAFFALELSDSSLKLFICSVGLSADVAGSAHYSTECRDAFSLTRMCRPI
jgi:hypothetical protein